MKQRWIMIGVKRLTIGMLQILLVFTILFPYQTSFAQSLTDRFPKEIVNNPLPKLLDFGRGKCIPCKAMAPILKELSEEYKDRIVIRIIEIDQEPELTRANRIRLIPTQIFFDAKIRKFLGMKGLWVKMTSRKYFRRWEFNKPWKLFSIISRNRSVETPFSPTWEFLWAGFSPHQVLAYWPPFRSSSDTWEDIGRGSPQGPALFSDLHSGPVDYVHDFRSYRLIHWRAIWNVSRTWYFIVGGVAVVIGLQLLGLYEFNMPVSVHLQPKQRGISGGLPPRSHLRYRVLSMCYPNPRPHPHFCRLKRRNPLWNLLIICLCNRSLCPDLCGWRRSGLCRRLH